MEFALILPVSMLLLLGMLEYGLAFSHHMTIQYATREGARAAAAMADGSIMDAACGGALTPTNVDPLVVAAVERVLTSPGSLVALGQVSNITIYKAMADGTPIGGKVNVWTYTPGAGPAIPCEAATRLDFSPPATVQWPASGRIAGTNPDSVGVSITYTYRFTTSLGSIMGMFGGPGAASLTMSDRTVMALEPTS